MCSWLAGCGVTLQECNLSLFRNAIKGVACAQTSVPLRNAIKIPKSCVHLRKFIVLSAVVSHCCNEKMVVGARKKELGAWHKNRREDSVNAATTP